MLNELFTIIEERKRHPSAGSYTASLLAAGQDRILQKVGEEAIEVLLAAKGQGRERLIAEVADLFYHTLVLLAAEDITLADIEFELRSRHLKPPAG